MILLHWEILDEKRYELLLKIVNVLDYVDYYMAGGTALAIQTGHRISYDFNFFVREEFNNSLLLESLNLIGNVKVIQNHKGTLDLIINDIQVSFFYFPNHLIDNYVLCDRIPCLKLASIMDITAMKMIAIGGRGAKKDFFDLYYICNQYQLHLQDLIQAIVLKYGSQHNFSHIIMGLTYFEDAENEILPQVFVHYNWEEIKDFFISIQSHYNEKQINN